MALKMTMTKAEAREKMLTAMREQDQDSFTEGLKLLVTHWLLI